MGADADSTPSPRRGRFAPSPTGPLHLGSLLVAFGSWLLARHDAAEWWIRIEDVDRVREVAGAAEAQLRTLAAFGLASDGPVLRQSTRGADYAGAVEQLLAVGLAFPCHCSRSALAASAGIHRACVPGPRRTDPAIRLRVSPASVVGFDDRVHGRVVQDVAREVGDVVLRRADGAWAYQLAVVVDDAGQGITDVARGADLLDSTPRQILLQRALGLPTPRHAHLPLVLDATGRKLSKSAAAAPVADSDPLPALRLAWRALGQPPAMLAGLPSLPGVLAAAVRGFDPARLPRGPLPLAALHNGVVANAE